MSTEQNLLLHSKLLIKCVWPTRSTSRTLPFDEWEAAGIERERKFEKLPQHLLMEHADDVNSSSSSLLMNGMEEDAGFIAAVDVHSVSYAIGIRELVSYPTGFLYMGALWLPRY